MKKVYSMFIELIPEFMKEIQIVANTIEKHGFKCLLMIEEQYVYEKKTYRDVVLTIDDSFNDDFIYVGMIEQVEHEFKYVVYDHKNRDLLMSLAGNYDCELCHVNRSRNEVHVALVHNIPKLFGSSCIQKFLPDVWQKIKYLQQFSKDLDNMESFIQSKMSGHSHYDILNKVDIFCLTLSKINEVGYNYFDNKKDKTQQLVVNVIRWAGFTEEDVLDRVDKDYGTIEDIRQKVLNSQIELENSRKNYKLFYEQFIQYAESEKENIDLTTYSTLCENKSDYSCFAYKIIYMTYKFNEKNIIIPRFSDKIKSFITQEKRIFDVGDFVKENAMIIKVSNTIAFDNIYKRCTEYMIYITVILFDGTLCSFKTSSPYILDNLNDYRKGAIINTKFKMVQLNEKDKYNFDMDVWKTKVVFRKPPLV